MFDETDKYRVISHQLGSSLTDKYQLRLLDFFEINVEKISNFR